MNPPSPPTPPISTTPAPLFAGDIPAERPIKLRPTCLSLRHKLMYCDERHAMPGMVDDSSNTRVFFCIKTMEQMGPDDQPVNPTACTGARKCFCGGVSSEGLMPAPPPSPAPDVA